MGLVCLLVPYFLPPCLAAAPIGNGAAEIHLRADVSDVPTCEVGELLCFLFVALYQLTPILFGRRTFFVAGPGVTQHVAALEIVAIGGFLQHKVFREMLGIVTNVHASDESVRRTGNNRPAHHRRRGFSYPKDTEASQFFK